MKINSLRGAKPIFGTANLVIFFDIQYPFRILYFKCYFTTCIIFFLYFKDIFSLFIIVLY